VPRPAAVGGLPHRNPRPTGGYQIGALSRGAGRQQCLARLQPDKREITGQHYAFLVSEEEFDASFGRIRERGLTYWADPGQARRGEINTRDGGRGLYFEDPDGHLLEILTRPYGSGD
jgi:catechol 2,3-dioxygenase-like lactoylglutathione lyase family enzyme